MAGREPGVAPGSQPTGAGHSAGAGTVPAAERRRWARGGAKGSNPDFTAAEGPGQGWRKLWEDFTPLQPGKRSARKQDVSHFILSSPILA